MVASGWQLAARLLDYPPGWWLVKDQFGDPFYCSIYFALPGDVPVYMGGLFKTRPHFPHGYSVSSDQA
jgi:hypothetical protein